MQSTLLLYFHFPDIIDKRRITLERVQFRIVSLHDITFNSEDTRREINRLRRILNVLIAKGLKGSFCLGGSFEQFLASITTSGTTSSFRWLVATSKPEMPVLDARSIAFRLPDFVLPHLRDFVFTTSSPNHRLFFPLFNEKTTSNGI